MTSGMPSAQDILRGEAVALRRDQVSGDTKLSEVALTEPRHDFSEGCMSSTITRLVIVFMLATTASQGLAQDTSPPKGRVTGIGGIFVKSPDPKALAAWYRDTLGITLEAWGGAALRYDAPNHPPVAVWSAFPNTTKMMSPSTREFMINFAVDDLDALLDRLKDKDVPILKRDDSDPSGRFAWIVDPDGTKIELWQPTTK